MGNIFMILEVEAGKEVDGKGLCVGLDVRIAGRQIPCAVSRVCRDYEDLSGEVEAIHRDLDRVLGQAKAFFSAPSSPEEAPLHPGMSPEETWSVLSEIDGEDRMLERFNGLEEARRRDIAEHVLTHCNIFAGTAAVFSARYDSKTGLMV